MKEEAGRNSYNSVFKAIALFGGVKVFQVLISVLRAKLIAILIGPTGMGISNLLTSTTHTISSVTGCGLQTSAVRDVAKAHELHNQERIDTTITVLRFLVWLTGILGAFVVFFGASILSRFAFGNTEYSIAFRILSLTMIFSQINVGQVALMQGTFHYKDMAKATLWGHLLSLILTIPIYYFYREEGIVPALLVASLITLFFSWRYSSKQAFNRVKLSVKKLFFHGKDMIVLGAVLALGGLISNLSSYLMNIFISSKGTLQDVGLYGAGVTIVNSYVFLVLTAMSTDYVPRIAALSGNDSEQINTINKQAVMVLLMIMPLITVFMVFAKEAIYILYSPDFYVIIPMVILFMGGTILQAVSWCLSYALVARGDSKVFLNLSVFSCIVSLTLKITGFTIDGLTGIGIAYIIDYLVYSIVLFCICNKLFKFKFSSEFRKLFFLFCPICGVSLVWAFLFPEGTLHYIVGTIIIIMTSFLSLVELNKRTNLINQLKSRIKKS